MHYFVVPAYNEEANIPKLIESVDAAAKRDGFSYRLIVVDDGSKDRTAEIVSSKSAAYPCEVVSYKPNKGVDEAFRRGFRRALESAKEEDLIVTMEADGTSDLGLLKTFQEKIRSGADLVVASYYTKGGSVESTVWYRKVLSWGANVLINLLFHMEGIHTYSSFYRMYRPAVLKKILSVYGDFYEAKGFGCVVELLIRIHRQKFRIEEVPMVLKGAARIGKSKMKVVRTIFGYLRIIGRNAFRRA